jgi:glycosyltransferase involved in cell wall biosynthesis
MSDSPLRVCFVIGYFYPIQSGAERQALEQGRELVRQGHTVHVVTRAAGRLPREEVVDGIQVHRWVRVLEVGPLFAFSFVSGVVQALRRLRPRIDIVHTHQALWEAVATGIAARGLRPVPTLVQPASSGYFGEAEELGRTKGRRSLRNCILRNSHFAAISADIEAQWLALGVPPARITRMASGVDTERFRPGPSTWEGRLPARPRVLFTGRLHPQKNLGVLVDAWPTVHSQTGAALILAGEGPERAALTQKIQEKGLSDCVRLLGAVEDVADLLRAADLFVLPSVAEGMSNSLLEAMATALPIVVSNIGGNQDLAVSGRTGELVAANNPGAWSSMLVELLRDENRRKTYGASAARTVQEQYALPVIAGRYLSLYRRLILES